MFFTIDQVKLGLKHVHYYNISGTFWFESCRGHKIVLLEMKIRLGLNGASVLIRIS